MAAFNYFKRRIWSKISPVIKRIILPVTLVVVILQTLSISSRKNDIPSNMVLPGEALDPFLKEQSIHQRAKSHILHTSTKNFRDNPLKTDQDDDDAKVTSKVNVLPSPVLQKKTSPTRISQEEANMPEKQYKKNADVPPRIETSWSMAKANIPDSDKVTFKAHAITNDTVTLTLMSSADKVFISLNKKEIYRGIDIRGLHVVVLNQYSGRIMAKRVFDTFEPGVEEDLVEFINDVTDGRIIVFAVLDEIATGLKWKGRNMLTELGSRWADKIGYRDMWALVTRKGGLKIAETFSNVATADTGYEWGGPVFLRTDFDLEENPVECEWPYNERNQARRLFCLRYEGYGPLCRCDVTQWEDVFFTVDKNLHRSLSHHRLHTDMAVIILATKRAHCLYRTLKSLWEAPGLNRDRLAIYTESASREVTALAKLFGVIVVESGVHKNCTVAQLVRHKVQRVLRDIMGLRFDRKTVPPNSLPTNTVPPFSTNNVLILEEDMIVSLDVFKYLYALYPLLEEDETVLGVSSINLNGYRMLSSSSTTFSRSNDHEVLGLLLPRWTAVKNLLPFWPAVEEPNDEWHLGIHKAFSSKSGDLVIPEMPRAKHSSFEGSLIKGKVQLDLFHEHILSLTTEYEIDPTAVMELKLNSYEANLKKKIKSAKALSFDFCQYDLEYGKSDIVTYVVYDGIDDHHIKNLMKCLGGWSIFPIGSWRGVWQFHFHGHLLFIVATPFSDYSYLMPSDFTPSTAPPVPKNASHTTEKTL